MIQWNGLAASSKCLSVYFGADGVFPFQGSKRYGVKLVERTRIVDRAFDFAEGFLLLSYLPLILFLLDMIQILFVRGRPLNLPLIAEPCDEDISKWHAIYVKDVERIFETYKKRVPQYKNKKLVIL